MFTIKLLSRGLLALSFVSQGYSMQEENSNLKRKAEDEIAPLPKHQCIEAQHPEQPMEIIKDKSTNLTSLPNDILKLILKECYGSFNNISETNKYLLELTNELTESLNPKDNWIFKIYQYSPSIESLCRSTLTTSNMKTRNTYVDSLIAKKKINETQLEDLLYPAFKDLFTRFKNLTSLDLASVNLSDPSKKFPVTFFSENSLEKLTNLQFLHISPSWYSSIEARPVRFASNYYPNSSCWFTMQKDIDNEKPEDTQNRLSILREQLKKLTNLRILICSGNVLTNDILECLPKLTNLDLSENKLVTTEGIKKMPSLEYLYLGQNASINIQILKEIPTLTFLDNSENENHTNLQILNIPSLKILFSNFRTLKIRNELNDLIELKGTGTDTWFRCQFVQHILNIARNPIGDPYETYLLKLKEGKKTNQ